MERGLRDRLGVLSLRARTRRTGRVLAAGCCLALACDGGPAPSDGAPARDAPGPLACEAGPGDAGDDPAGRARALCEAGCELSARTCPDTDLPRCLRGCRAAAEVRACAREFLELMACLDALPASAFDCVRGARLVNDGSCRAEQAAYFDCAFVPAEDAAAPG